MSIEETEPAEQQPATSAFPNQMIEQIQHRSWAKAVREFLSSSHWSLLSETNVKKRKVYKTN